MGSDQELKVEIFHHETIKPPSPTPDHLKNSNLSIFDQLAPEIYVPILLFFPNNISDNDDLHSVVFERSKTLKKSLSETLTHFYPFAGQFQYNDSICCNDHGAAFSEARVNCPMRRILDQPDLGISAKQLLPADMGSTDSKAATTGHLVLVQVNLFECGGLAIGLSFSHKVADAYTINSFINSWAATATSEDHVVVISKEFGAAASLFPPLGFLNTPQPGAMELATKNCATRRFVFDASKIGELKSKAASVSLPNPTRVEVVSALIWKCALEASRSNSLGSIRPSTWCQAVNMRKILAPVRSSAEHLLGNLVSYSMANPKESEGDDGHDLDLQSLAATLRKGIEKFKVRYGNGVSGIDACQNFKEFGSLLLSEDIDNYSCTSWCKFPFYEANFGWGKPSWVLIASVKFKNVIVLMDTKDGDGIEAHLTFNVEDMAIIENSKELLAYASLSPTFM